MTGRRTHSSCPAAGAGGPDARDERCVRVAGSAPRGVRATSGWHDRRVRTDVLAAIAALIPTRPGGYVRVGIDGVDGAGKTTFADALATQLAASGRRCARVRADDFLNARAVRYRLGRDSPVGFFRDSYNLARLHDDVLRPFASATSRVSGCT